MPRRTREYLKHYACQADNDLDRALAKIMQMVDLYGENYPQHLTALLAVGSLIQQTREFLDDFREKMI